MILNTVYVAIENQCHLKYFLSSWSLKRSWKTFETIWSRKGAGLVSTPLQNVWDRIKKLTQLSLYRHFWRRPAAESHPRSLPCPAGRHWLRKGTPSGQKTKDVRVASVQFNLEGFGRIHSNAIEATGRQLTTDDWRKRRTQQQLEFWPHLLAAQWYRYVPHQRTTALDDGK